MFLRTNQHIPIVSEGSRDTEDCSNDAKNPALHYSSKDFKFKVQSYFTLILFYSIFNQINVAFVIIRDIKRIQKSLTVLPL